MTSVPSSPDELEQRLGELLHAPRAAVTWEDEPDAADLTVADDGAALSDVVDALRTLADVPEDVARAHVARLQGVVPAAPVVPIQRDRRRNVARTGAGAVVLAGVLTSGIGVAAASEALPGDPLYGLKTARERLVVTMARGGDDRASVHLRLARTRLDEAAELLRRGDTERGLATLARADAALAAAKAHGGSGIDDEADDELSHRVEVLTALLQGGLPDSAAEAAREAIGRAVERAPGRPAEPGRPTDVPTTRPTPKPTARPTDTGRPDDVRTAPPTKPTGRGDGRAVRPTPRPQQPNTGRGTR